MPPLPGRLIESFKRAWLEAFGEQVSDEDAQRYGREVLDTMGLLLMIGARTIKEQTARKEHAKSSRGQ